MTMRNGKRPRESDAVLATGDAWESHVDKRPRSDTFNVEDDRRQQREAEVSRSLGLGAHPPAQPVERPGVPAATDTSAFIVPNRPSPAYRADDKEGHYVFQLGENLTSRYKILSKMGEGTFGRVLECWDRKHRTYVAIKIVRNVKKYRDAAMIELEVLNTLEKNDPQNRWHCVHLQEWFDYRGHVCMVFEKLGLSLYDFLRVNQYRPFKINVVRDFGRQLLESVAYLHSLQLIHTDLKPENILLAAIDDERKSPTPGVRKSAPQQPATSQIKVIDFGSATFSDQYHSTVVSTRHYRAPEVILGLGWSFEADIWSIGCILVELVTGDALFQTHENMEHLAMMEAVLGPIPKSMAQASKGLHNCFVGRDFRLNWPADASKRSIRVVDKMTGLKQLLRESGEPSVRPHIDALCNLLQKLLQYQPQQRITAHQALQHSFFHATYDIVDLTDS
ncbi:hypothetical protein ABBQ32_007343 [Trebouxia sp. C0010 RCD-2024]